MTYYKSAPNPFLSGVKLEDGGETPVVENTLYKQLVGILLYLIHSRPDLSYAVGVVSRFMQESHELHWKDAKCILQYVHGTITFGNHYATDSTLDLIGFTNSDWAGVTLIASPHLVNHLVLVLGLSIGRERSKLPFLYIQLRQSTKG
jgi:hypothetical protein